MGWLDRFRQKASQPLETKAITQSEMRFPGRSFVFFDFPRASDDDMRREVGDGTSANVLMTPIRWLQRAIVEAPIGIELNDEIAFRGPVVDLLNRPNPFYSIEHLLAGTVLSLVLDGNAYWLCVRNRSGGLAEIWYVPHPFIRPEFPNDGTTFISHYVYTVGTEQRKIDVEDVIHFRDGIDPDNLRFGLSPLKSLLKEVWTDQEAGLFTASLLRNSGVPGLVLAPDSDQVSVDAAQAEAVRAKIESQFTRDGRGRTIVMQGKTKVEQFGFSPEQMDLSGLRNVSEERVAAALGIPAAVLGFGTGIEQTQVGATLKELRRLAWNNAVIPMQNLIAGELDQKLMPLMDERGEVVFDRSQVGALQEDERERVERIARLVTGGVWTRAEGRTATGMEATDADEVFYVPISAQVVPRDDRPQPRPAAPPSLPDPETRDSRRGIRTKGHSLLEQRIAASAPKIEPTRELMAVGETLDRIRESAIGPFERMMLDFLDRLGEAIESAAREQMPDVLREAPDSAELDELSGIQSRAAAQRIETKRIGEIEETSARIASAARLPEFEQSLNDGFSARYLEVARDVQKEMGSVFNLATDLTDPQARAIVSTGGRRAGLLDVTNKARRDIFRGLLEGRTAGLGGENLARAIRDRVEAGPWSSPEIRARVIARTETLHAAARSSIETARNADTVQSMVVLDNRTGFGDEVCTALNGRIVTIDEAEQLAFDEHPNGTRNFTPLPDGAREILESEGRVTPAGPGDRVEET